MQCYNSSNVIGTWFEHSENFTNVQKNLLIKFYDKIYPYSKEEKINMMLIYGEAKRNTVRACELYTELYSRATHSSRVTFQCYLFSLQDHFKIIFRSLTSS